MIGPLLHLHNITVRFGGVTAVDEVSLEVGMNELLGFIGPNGAGKTTLMRIITGIVRPDEGRVVFDGEDITRWPVHRRVRAGLALGQQIVRPLHGLTLLDNVALAVGAHSFAGPAAALFAVARLRHHQRARQLLDTVGIADQADALPKEVPLGILKRLEVARALALEPKLVLLDEPLAGLNQVEARDMASLIAGLAGGGRSVMLIEHNLREVIRVCPRLYVQDNGRPLADGPTPVVMARPDVRRAYLGREVA